MARAEVDYVFRFHKQEIISMLGRTETSNDQINKLGKSIFKNRWGGALSEAVVRLDKRIANKYFILNTGNQKSGGIHWVGMFIGNGKALYVYDSFGRRSSLILRTLVKQAHEKGYKIVESNHDHEQRGYSAVCGQISLAWLITAKDLGIKNALQI